MHWLLTTEVHIVSEVTIKALAEMRLCNTTVYEMQLIEPPATRTPPSYSAMLQAGSDAIPVAAALVLD